MDRGEGWEPYPGAASSFWGIAKGAMPDNPFPRRAFAVVDRFQAITPLVEQPLMDTELSGQSQHVLAALQPLHRHLPKCLGVPSHSSLCHSQFLSLQGVPIASVSTFGFSP
jgi:hypothetical protein